MNIEFNTRKTEIENLYLNNTTLKNIKAILNLEISIRTLAYYIKNSDLYEKKIIQKEVIKQAIIQDYINGLSIRHLVNKYKKSQEDISKLLKSENNIQIRTSSYYNTCKKCTELSLEQKYIIDGLILGDGSIVLPKDQTTPYISLGNTQKEWIDYIRSVLPFENTITTVPASTTTFKTKKGYKTYSKKIAYYYKSKTDISLINIYYKWSVNNRKTISFDLYLHPLTVLHWFYGDGYSCYTKGKKQITVSLCTHNFNEQEVKILQQKFKEININFRIYKKDIYFMLVMHRKSEIIKFFEYIKPVHCIKAFDYKFKEYTT